MATKVIHQELASDLTKDTFLDAGSDYYPEEVNAITYVVIVVKM